MHTYYDFKVSDHVRDDNYDKEDELSVLMQLKYFNVPDNVREDSQYDKECPRKPLLMPSASRRLHHTTGLDNPNGLLRKEDRNDDHGDLSKTDGSKLSYSTNDSRASGTEHPADADPTPHIDLTIGFGEAGDTNLSWDQMSFGGVDISYLGRMVIPSIYGNFKRFIQLQPTVNLVALTIDLIAMILSGYPPLTPLHVLWANLILDTLGGVDQRPGQLQELAQRTHDLEMPHGDHAEGRPLVSKALMTKSRLLQAAYQILILFTIHFGGQQLLSVIKLQGPDNIVTGGDRAIVNTIIFNAFVFCQLFEAINARSEARIRLTNIIRGLLDIQQRRFMGFWVTALMLQVVMVECLHYFASTVKLSWKYWVLCSVVGFVNWPVALVGKLIPVTDPRRDVNEIEEEAAP